VLIIAITVIIVAAIGVVDFFKIFILRDLLWHGGRYIKVRILKHECSILLR